MNDLTNLPQIPENALSALSGALASINFEPPKFDDKAVRELTGIHRSEFETDPFINSKPGVTEHGSHMVLQSLEPRVACWVEKHRRWFVLTPEAGLTYLAGEEGRAEQVVVFDDIESVHRTQPQAYRALRALPEAGQLRRDTLDDLAQEFALRGLKFIAVGMGIRDYRQRRGEEERERDAIGDGWERGRRDVLSY